MCDSSGSSSGTSRGPWGRGKVFGIPQMCWCGQRIVSKIARSEPNPFRRYYWCGYAAQLKLKNDEHVFKWVDQASIDELQRVDCRIACLEIELKDMKVVRKSGIDEDEFEKMIIRIDDEISQRIEDCYNEAKSSFLKLVILVLLGCLLAVVVGRIVKACMIV